MNNSFTFSVLCFFFDFFFGFEGMVLRMSRIPARDPACGPKCVRVHPEVA